MGYMLLRLSVTNMFLYVLIKEDGLTNDRQFRKRNIVD